MSTAPQPDPKALAARPSPYTYTDEQWKVHTVHPQRYYSRSREDGTLRPTLPAPCVSIGNPDIAPRTAAEKAREADKALWGSCKSVDEYEGKRREMDDVAAARAVEAGRPAFHPFPRLPAELRCRIWVVAMVNNPTRIAITCSGYTPARRPQGGWCGTVAPGRPRIYAATAFMPPLMLVNWEAHALASRHYRRAFRGVNGGGGVLAAYPSILTIEKPMVLLLPMDRAEDLGLLAEIVVIVSPGLGGRVAFSTEYSERFKMMLRVGTIRRLELRLTRSIPRDRARRVEEYFASLFSEIQAANEEWVAPELQVGPVHDEEKPRNDSESSSKDLYSDDD
ncbi:hypothetical protein ASPACDRAFT_56869 [Aspergillus aculeatus ATCC 16872]|uniref:2EXR domain-containing protein n=1 Tax=Aspergillus aculeatus (strain ATCC 16872 / CBS 172.66 / WB 5094) TaxID=690307 RepID=A0A1L9X4T7_ASPA1|nr:uncharacterized protein ASPACDRAFT_56869 [Aspergillus aculeatus ATCC 16872]OJK03461.1 hypothetical protein ASPACDRAFT_56869 [Aspergillus aculeatus ATCC 16872]